MKILHTADWHIGSFKGPEKEGVNLRSEDTMKCLRSLVETAEKENALKKPCMSIAAVFAHAYLCRACFENSCKNMGVELPKLDYMED